MGDMWVVVQWQGPGERLVFSGFQGLTPGAFVAPAVCPVFPCQGTLDCRRSDLGTMGSQSHLAFLPGGFLCVLGRICAITYIGAAEAALWCLWGSLS